VATTEKWAKLFKSRHQYMDNVPVQFGDAKDAVFKWDGTNLTLKPVANDTGAFIVGDGTTSMDFKVFGGTTGKYILFDVGNSLFTVSAGIGLSLADTTDASSLTTGSITTLGGVSITKQLYLGDDIDMSVSGTGVYDITLKDAVADALSIVRGTTDMMVFNSSTPSITITPATTVTGLLTTTGGITNNSAGIAAAGAISGATTIAASTSVTVTSASASALAVGRLGATTPALVVDASAATSITGIKITSAAASGGVAVVAVGESSVALTINAAGTGTIGIGSVSTGAVTITPATTVMGTLTVGADAAGADFTLYGAVTAYKAWWDANGDTNGTFYFGADTKGVDVKAYGATTGNYLHWDASADDLLLVGTATQLAVAGTTASSSTTTGSLRTAGGLGVVGDAYFGGRLDVTATAVHATTGRVGKFTGTVTTPNQGDGYGVFEIDITSSGTVAGTTNAFSSWLNFAAESVPGGNLICAQNNGIWLATGVVASSAKMVMGMRMQYVADDGANPGSLYCFSTNIFSNVLTAIFDVNAIVDLGGSTGAATTNGYKIPLFRDASAGKTWYVNVYDG